MLACLFSASHGSVVQMACAASLQAWSSCVDTERTEGHDFTEECRQTVCQLAALCSTCEEHCSLW